jgi:hypothetical protein
MNVQDVYRTRLLNRLEVLLLFKPEAFWIMKAEHQDPLDLTVQIARNKTGYPGPWSPAELVSVNIGGHLVFVQSHAKAFLIEANALKAGGLGTPPALIWARSGRCCC